MNGGEHEAQGVEQEEMIEPGHENYYEAMVMKMEAYRE